MARIDAKRSFPKILSPNIREVSGLVVIDTNDYDGRIVLIPNCKVYRVRAIRVVKRHRCLTAALTTFNIDVGAEDLEAGTTNTLVDSAGVVPAGSVLQNTEAVVETFFFHVDAAKCWRNLIVQNSSTSTRRTADTNLQLVFSSGNFFATSNDGRVPTGTQDKAPCIVLTYTPGSATAVNANILATLYYEPLFEDDLNAVL